VAYCLHQVRSRRCKKCTASASSVV
jgi:hypothetical protein